MDRALLEEMLSEGLSLATIGDRLGFDASTVGKAAKRFGLEVPGRERYAAKPIDSADLAARVEAGATQRELADVFGVSVVTVQRHLGRHGLKTGGRTRRADRLASATPREREEICVRHGRTIFSLDGRGSWRCLCCRSEAVARRRRRVKEVLVEEAGGACALCGYRRCARALHFHHLDPGTKRFGLGQGGWSRGIDALRAEARKCVLLCSNCHAEVEAGIVIVPPDARRVCAAGENGRG
jgi:DNA-binding CsgD family transcriptional regulator